MFYSLKKQMFKRKWRKLNPHNFTNAEDLFEPACVNVGNYTYGGLRVLTYNKINKLSIGRFCSIAQEVMFVLSADHYIEHISSYPYKVWIMKEEQEGVSKGNIVVEDDVWIGFRSTILFGRTHWTRSDSCCGFCCYKRHTAVCDCGWSTSKK